MPEKLGEIRGKLDLVRVIQVRVIGVLLYLLLCMNVPKNYVHIGRKEQKQNLKYVGCC